MDGTPVTPQGGNAPADSAATAPVTAGAVIPMRRAERAGAVARRAGNAAAEAARELWLHPDRLVHVIVRGKAETMAAHRAYVKSRGWVPAGMEGGPEKAVTIAGLAHYLIVARPLKAAMKAVKFAAEKVEQAADRALRLYLTLAIVLAVLLITGIL
ncbi:MAG TPA: hypothetical protein VFQ68_17435 [Streptosporangiaceae bacterium]|nr:hypothetical protein [Streptosporangiaceae bacterium]